MPVEPASELTRAPLDQVRPVAAQLTEPEILPDPEVPPRPEALAEPAETLDDAWMIAFRAADRVAAARFSVAEAESLRCAATAERWPDLGVSAQYRVRQDERSLVVDRSTIGLPPLGLPFAQSEAFGFRSAVTLPLYTSGRISSQIDAAESWVQAARSTVAMEQSQLRIQVAEEYLAVLRAQSEVDVAHSTIRSLEAHADEVEKRFNHGLTARNDLLAAQVSLANAQHASIRAENQLDVARAAYNRRLGRPLATPVQLAELSVPAETEDLDTLTAIAVQQRQELARLACEAAAARNEAAAILAEKGLQLGVTGEYLFEENRYETPQGLASAVVGASWRAFDAGQIRHRAMAAHRRADALLRLRADLESAIRVEIRTLWLNVQETARRIQVAEDAIGRAEENLRVARRLYATGTGTAREVLEAESLRTETERNRSNAHYDCVIENLRLKKAIGQL